MIVLFLDNGDRRGCAGVVDEHQLFARNENRRGAVADPYGEKTRPGQCPEQQRIAPAPVDDK